MQSRRAAIRVPVRRASCPRRRRGLGGRPRRRAVVRVLPAVVPVLRPTRPGQRRGARTAATSPARRTPTAVAAQDRQDGRARVSSRCHRVPGVLRAVRAPVHAGQGERDIRHGGVHRIRTHIETEINQEEQGECNRCTCGVIIVTVIGF